MSDEQKLLQRKVMLMCFLGTHIPLTVLCIYAMTSGVAGVGMMLLATLLATVVGAGVALLAVRNGFRAMATAN
ncbi:hypothetical protein HCZ30_06345 [Marivivens donghaensis]|uniref:Uncharacterized protein n=1 Tax=Marivivens donghaensis TaxID=1699413 RepID=A0ABX0VVE8_9RHOB|nr:MULTISPECIES: hypothetical protein [Marivivens]NIY72053.1 hypothetical protein [Marivivens donghaensis]